MHDVANSATIITTMAPTRSDHGARLKSTHHTRIATPLASPPIIPNKKVSGMNIGTANMKRRSTAAMTPGHSRSGFRVVESSVCAVDISLFRSECVSDIHPPPGPEDQDESTRPSPDVRHLGGTSRSET